MPVFFRLMPPMYGLATAAAFSQRLIGSQFVNVEISKINCFLCLFTRCGVAFCYSPSAFYAIQFMGLQLLIVSHWKFTFADL